MNKFYHFSLLVLLVPLSCLCVEVNSLDDIILKSKISSNLNLYSNTKINKKSDNYNINKLSKRASYLNRNATIKFETASFGGFIFKTNVSTDMDSSLSIPSQMVNSYNSSSNTILNESYLKYQSQDFYLKVGKQIVFIDALDEYNKALIAGFDFDSDSNITLGWTQKTSSLYTKNNKNYFFSFEEDGIYVAKIKFKSFDTAKINFLYYFPSSQLHDWYTLKTVLKTNYFTTLMQYTNSKDSLHDDKNGYLSHVKLNTNLYNFSLATGYIKIYKEIQDEAKDIAINGVSPFDQGSRIYNKNAKTIYGSVGYKFLDFDTNIIYGETLYELDSIHLKQDEINFLVKYFITNAVETSFLHTSIYSQELANNQEKFLVYLKYTF